MKGVWKRLFGEIVGNHTNYENDIQNIIKEISFIATSGGIDVDDIRTLLKSHGEPLTNEELQEMNCNTKSQEYDVSEPVPVRKLSVKIIEKALSLHNQCMELLEENDEDYERVSAVKRGCAGLFDSYRQILHNKRREAKQGNLDSFLQSETK
ncbi:hypothetical protein QE152_g38588 [Popillia japonica]|uniref:Uncharacterized protein n=1 Tax=Popillia japonica TaxID=7064 RepID=A0AAW1HWX1_POPJA